MSKCFLVLDKLPESCTECPLSYYVNSEPEDILVCPVRHKKVDKINRSKWCELKEVSEIVGR